MKRARKDTLTGGTKDVSPQWMSIVIPTTSTPLETSYQLPITRIPQGDVATIIEVLEVRVDWNDVSAAGAAAQAVQEAVVTFGTKSFGTTANNATGEPTVFDAHRIKFQNAFTAAGTGFTNWDAISIHNMEDGAGHGVLVANDVLYVQYNTTGGTVTSASGKIFGKLLYRFKAVTIQEYVGIVQSQQ